jgi:hypothetical protein
MLTGDLNENRTFGACSDLRGWSSDYGVPAPGSERRLAR